MNNLIDSISARIEVSSISEALPLYQALAGVDEAPILEFPGLRLAVVGPFLVIEGDAETLKKLHREATLHVNDLDAAVNSFVKEGGSVIDGPTEAAGGLRTIVADRDGNVFECFYRPAD
jgi:predicted enzyme related to lactoylglutathione lyase